MEVLNIRERRKEIMGIMMAAAKQYTLEQDPTLANDATGKKWADAINALIATMVITPNSFLRMPFSLLYGGNPTTSIVFNPKVTTNASSRSDFQGLNQEDLFIAFAEDLLIDGRLTGNNASADYQTWLNPLHFLDGAIYTNQAKLNTLNALYTAVESVTINQKSYKNNESTRKYLRIPRVNSTLLSGAATGKYNIVDTDTRGIDMASYLMISGNKTTTIQLSLQSTPALAVPDGTAGTELDVTKVYYGFLVNQGAVLYDALMGQIIG